MTTTREPVTLAFKAYEQDFTTQILQSCKELLSLFDVTAQILFAMQYQQWGVHLLHISDRRHAPVTFYIVPGRRIHLIVGKDPANVARAEVRYQVRDTSLGYRGPEAIGVTNQPVRHKATIAATGNTYALFVDVTFLQQCIHACHDIQRVFFTPCSTHCQRKVPSIAATTPRVGVEQDIARS